MSLYLKYRPQSFNDLVGQEHISKTLINALKKERVAHAYLFYGPRGTGKTSTARLIAMAINCESPIEGGQACGKCNFCVEAKEGSLIDIIEIDAASNRGIDEIRDLKEKIKFAPVRGKKKVYIIDEVHMLTKEAFNALLKTLEEPPEHAHFILATTEIHKVPETIISRCQRFDFRRIQKEHITGRLSHIAKEEKIKADSEALAVIATVANGGLRDAIGLLEQLSNEDELTLEKVQNSLGLSNELSVSRLYESIQQKKVNDALAIIDEIYQTGADLFEFNNQYLHYLRDKMHEKLKSNESCASILEQIGIFQETGLKLKNTIIPQLPLEVAVIKICQMREVIAQTTQVVSEAQAAPTIKPEQPSNPPKTPITFKPQERQQRSISKPETSAPASTPTPAEQQAATPQKKAPTIDVNLGELQKKWNTITSHIKRPALRLSLKEGYATSLEGNQLTIRFSSTFHLERVKKAENVALIESALEQACDSKLSVIVELGEAQINRSASTSATPAPIPRPQQNTTPPKVEEDLAAKAADIFGGTLL